MKKRLYIILSLLCLVAMPCNAQKKVSWLHGLNSDESFWQRYRVTLVEQIYRNTPLRYDCDEGIENVSRDLEAYHFNNSNYNHILIGHSAGGLVARTMLHKPNGAPNPKYKALITAGTPHFGAGVVESIADSTRTYIHMIDALEQEVSDLAMSAYDTVVELSEELILNHPIVDLYEISVLFNPFSHIINHYFTSYINTKLAELKQSIRNSVEDWMDNNVEPAIIDIADGFWAQEFVRDMHPDSQFIYDLNHSYEPFPVPTISISGIAGQWAALKLASSLKNKDLVSDIHNTENNPYDYDYINIMQSAEAFTIKAIFALSRLHTIFGFLSFYDVDYFTNSDELLSIQAGFEQLQEYLMYDFDNQYAEYVVKAYHEEVRTVSVPVYRDNDDNYDIIEPDIDNELDETPDDHLEFEIPDIVYYEERTYITKTYEPHDGLVRQKDSEIPSGLGHSIRNISIPDMNHMSMNAHWQMEDFLRNTLNGNNGYETDFVYKQ